MTSIEERLERYLETRIRLKFEGKILDDVVRVELIEELETMWTELQRADPNCADVLQWPRGMPSDEILMKYLDERESALAVESCGRNEK